MTEQYFLLLLLWVLIITRLAGTSRFFARKDEATEDGMEKSRLDWSLCVQWKGDSECSPAAAALNFWKTIAPKHFPTKALLLHYKTPCWPLMAIAILKYTPQPVLWSHSIAFPMLKKLVIHTVRSLLDEKCQINDRMPDKYVVIISLWFIEKFEKIRL